VLAESLEATFYDTALKKFTAQDFTDAGFVDGEIVFEQLTWVAGHPPLRGPDSTSSCAYGTSTEVTLSLFPRRSLFHHLAC
jgi:hypothetical protein